MMDTRESVEGFECLWNLPKGISTMSICLKELARKKLEGGGISHVNERNETFQ